MRVSQVLPQPHGKESNNLRSTIITHLLGKKSSGVKLRPSARVGLEWARLAAGEAADAALAASPRQPARAEISTD
jgi:hypothetical protein